MEINVKVGDSRYPDNPGYYKTWRDGQIIDMRPDGYYAQCKSSRMFNCIIQTPHDYWQVRGSNDWKSTAASVYNNIKKFLVPLQSDGKYPWESAKLDEERKHPRLTEYPLSDHRCPVSPNRQQGTAQLPARPCPLVPTCSPQQSRPAASAAQP